MQIFKFGAALAGLFMVGQAMAASPGDLSAPVIGVWVDKLPDGSSMMIDFASHGVTFHTMDTRGMGSGPPTTISVQYRKMPNGSLMLVPTGDVGEPMAVRVNGPDVMVIQFEGMQPRTLVRQKEQPAQKPHGH